MPKFSFIPREERFYALFEESATNIVKASQMLKELVDTWDDVEGKVAVINKLEHTGDSIAHEIIARLHRSFITPFDREDIALLAHSLDDIIDFIDDAATAMLVYRVESPGSRVKELAGLIVQTAVQVEKALSRFKKRSELKSVLEQCVEINRLENIGDVIFRDMMADLFKDSQDAGHIIKWREIYQDMESTLDRCEDVSNVLEGVIIKNA